MLGKSSRRSLVALLRAMLSADPRGRPSMAQVLQSAPFAAGGAGNGKGGKKGIVLGGAKKGPGRAGGANEEIFSPSTAFYSETNACPYYARFVLA